MIVTQGSQLAFDAATHIYKLNGVRIPGVTEVMKFAGLVDDRWFTEESSWRGTAIHLACELDDQDDLDPASVDEPVRLKLEGYRKFKKTMAFIPKTIEEMVCGKIGGMLVAGRPDRTGFLGLLPIVMDLKSGAVPPQTAIQLAAYSELTGIDQRVAVRLVDNDFILKPYLLRTRRDDVRQFQSALAGWWWKHNNG